MNYEIITTNTFKRDLKPLLKKYPSLVDDLEQFKKELLENPEIDDKLGNNTRNICMAITSKNKGKNSGARMITFDLIADFNNINIYLNILNDKSKKVSISRNKIKQLKRGYGLILKKCSFGVKPNFVKPQFQNTQSE